MSFSQAYRLMTRFQPSEPRIIDVTIPISRIKTPFAAVLGYVIGIVGFIIVLALLSLFIPGVGAGLPWIFILIFSSVLILLLCLPWIQSYRYRRRVRAYMRDKENEDPAAIAREVVQLRPRLAKYSGIHEMVNQFRDQQQYGLIFRFADAQEMNSIKPLTQPIEPRLLDESDEAFQELHAALAADSDPENVPQYRSSISRNIILKEGRTELGLTLLCCAFVLLRTFMTGRVTCVTMILPLVLVFTLFSPVTGSFADIKWFLICGGILCDLSSTKSDQTYQLRRPLSVLACYQLNWHKWQVFLADPVVEHDRPATRKEVHMLLSAWLSPLPPPPGHPYDDDDDE